MNRIAKLSRIRECFAVVTTEAEHASRRQSSSLVDPKEIDRLAADLMVDRAPRRHESDQSHVLSMLDELDREGRA